MKNPFSKEAFLDWVERQPADKEYNYNATHACAYYQYLTFMGFNVFLVGGFVWTDKDNKDHDLPDFLTDDNFILNTEPQTFGALAERLRA